MYAYGNQWILLTPYHTTERGFSATNLSLERFFCGCFASAVTRVIDSEESVKTTLQLWLLGMSFTGGQRSVGITPAFPSPHHGSPAHVRVNSHSQTVFPTEAFQSIITQIILSQSLLNNISYLHVGVIITQLFK